MTRLAWMLVSAAAAVSAGCDGLDTARGQPGEPAPEYVALTLSGDTVSLAGLQGSVVLLNIWATWCPPCIEEIPALQELHERHVDEGLRIVGVSIDGRGEQENVRRFAENLNVTYTIWHDPEDQVGGLFRTIGVPTTVLIDREGVVVWRHMGPITADDPALNRMLRETIGSES